MRKAGNLRLYLNLSVFRFFSVFFSTCTVMLNLLTPLCQTWLQNQPLLYKQANREFLSAEKWSKDRNVWRSYDQYVGILWAIG